MIHTLCHLICEMMLPIPNLAFPEEVTVINKELEATSLWLLELGGFFNPQTAQMLKTAKLYDLIHHPFALLLR